MMSAAKSSPPNSKLHKASSVFSGQDSRKGLGEYLKDPANNPNVLSYNDDFVVIKDLFPKATVHLLILPRDPIKQTQHPSEALQDLTFFTKLKVEASKWRTLAAKELRSEEHTSELQS